MAMLLVPIFCGTLILVHRVQSTKQYRQLRSRWQQKRVAQVTSGLAEQLGTADEGLNALGDELGDEQTVDDSLLGDMFLNRTFIFLFGTCKCIHPSKV
jgi:hypothetical protein